MNNRISAKAREKWDAFISTEGKAAGLSGCRPFLESKTVNDIFYEGMFKNRPCIVKCSSRAPDAICNEYRVMRQLYEVDTGVFPEPYACCVSKDGRLAFVAMERLSGDTAVDPAGDFVRMAKALEKTGIVHRDILKNILPGADRHLKLIDFQFAVDRNNYQESSYMRRNPKYLYTVFGVQKSLWLGAWNDCTELLIALRLYKVPEDNPAYAKLLSMEQGMFFCPPIGWFVRLRLLFYKISLRLQHAFAVGKKRQAIARRLETLSSSPGGRA
jgi:serine/threonine protein kinase